MFKILSSLLNGYICIFKKLKFNHKKLENKKYT